MYKILSFIKDRVKVTEHVMMWPIPSSEKDRVMAVRIQTAVAVPILTMLRLETIVVTNYTGPKTLVYAISVNIMSQITPVIKGVQMIWRMDTATTVERILRPRSKSKKKNQTTNKKESRNTKK